MLVVVGKNSGLLLEGVFSLLLRKMSEKKRSFSATAVASLSRAPMR